MKYKIQYYKRYKVYSLYVLYKVADNRVTANMFHTLKEIERHI